MSIDEVAARTGAQRTTAVEKSLAVVEEYKLCHSNEVVDLKINEVVLQSIGSVARVFKDGMTAKRADKSGKQVPDHLVRLKTVETMKTFAELARPRTPGVQVNTQVNNNVPGAGSSESGGSFEARLRQIREAKGLDNGEGVEELDAELVNEQQSAEDELADMGLDIGDEDEDGEDEDEE